MTSETAQHYSHRGHSASQIKDGKTQAPRPPTPPQWEERQSSAVRRNNVLVVGKYNQPRHLSHFSIPPPASIPEITLGSIHHFLSLTLLHGIRSCFIGIFFFSEIQSYPHHTVLSEVNEYFMKTPRKISDIKQAYVFI